MKDDTRPFPIQAEGLQRKPEPHYPKRSFIPWWLAEVAYERYCEKYGRDTQTLECIGQRSGFGRQELVMLIRRVTCYSATFGPNDTRPFPIGRKSTIPWWLAEIAFTNFDKWPGCTLESVAAHGGWTRYELVKLLETSFD